MPGMDDPAFARSVVYICEHNQHGALGLCINKPLGMTLAELFEQIRMPLKRQDLQDLPVCWGGPVQPERVTVLLRHPRRPDGSAMVVSEVYRTTELEVLREALEDQRPDRQVRVYSGYAGWSPGQLEREVRLGAWFLDRAEADAVFALDPEPLWERVRDIMRRVQAE